MPARPYQAECNSNVLTDYDAGWRQLLVSMATGTGKTWVFSDLYEQIKTRLPGRMLVLAHTEELVNQNLATMRVVNPALRIDKEMAKYKSDPSQADVVVASVATLGRLNTSRLDKFKTENFDKVIIDEAHHTPAQSYLNVLSALKVTEYGTDKLLLGCTATPERADGKALGQIYKKITYVYSLRQAITEGWLVKIRGFRAGTCKDISTVSINGGDFNHVELEAAVDSEDRNELVVDSWLSHCEHRKTVVYSAGILHAQHLAEKFQKRGIQAHAVWGEDPERKAKLEWHRNTPSSILVNAALIIEGYDDPSIACVLIAAPTASPVKFTQMCGRPTRLHPGKTDCIILVIEDICAHSLCTLPTLMGMPAGLDLQGHDLTDTVQLLEDLQAENPSIDFSKLKTVDGVKRFIEEINLFEIRFPKEVEDNSEFRWSRAVDGGFVMRIPRPTADTTGTKPGLVRIHQNQLDKWVVDGIIKEKGFHGERESIEAIFAVADQQIRQRSPESVSIVNRKAGWTTKPATPKQMTMLARLYGKARTWPELTQGQASSWIDRRIGGKK